MHRDTFNITPNKNLLKEIQSYSDKAVATASGAEGEAWRKIQKYFKYSATKKKERKEIFRAKLFILFSGSNFRKFIDHNPLK